MSSRVARFVAHAVQVLERLAIDETGERMCGSGNPDGQQRTDLVEQPVPELRVHPARHPRRRGLGRNLQRERRSPRTQAAASRVSAKCAVSGRPVRK